MQANITVNELTALQKKIKQMNEERAKTEGRRSSLMEQLKNSLEDYAKTYKVDIHGTKIKEIKAFCEQELERVSKEKKAEYELKKKLVDLHDLQDIDGMRKILGIEEAEDDFVVDLKYAEKEEQKAEPKKAEPKPEPKKAEDIQKVQEAEMADAFSDFMDEDFDTEEVETVSEEAVEVKVEPSKPATPADDGDYGDNDPLAFNFDFDWS